MEAIRNGGKEVCTDVNFQNFQTPNRRFKKAKVKTGKKEEKGEKSRTPSGQIINTSVKDIRDFFVSGCKAKTEGSKQALDYSRVRLFDDVNRSKGQHGQLTTLTVCDHSTDNTSIETEYNDEPLTDHDWNVVDKQHRRKRIKQKQQKHMFELPLSSISNLTNRFSQLASNSDLSSIGDKSAVEENCDPFELFQGDTQQSASGNYKTNTADVNCKAVNAENCESNQSVTQRSVSVNHKANTYDSDINAIMDLDQDTESEQLSQRVEREIRSMADPENPQLMDIQIVIQMFSELQKEIAEIKKTNTANTNTKSEDEKKNVTVQQYMDKTDLLTSIVERIGHVNEDLKTRLDLIETRGMRRSILVGGLKTDNRLTKYLQQVESWVTEELEAEITVVDCFKLGTGETKPVVITVESLQQKIKLFQAMDKYRKAKKQQDIEVKVYLTDFLPPEIKEQRKREREIFKQNENDQATSIPMNLTRNGLEIQGTMYTKKVVTPDSTKILSYSADHLAKICNMKLQKGNEVTVDGNKFIGFVLPANSHSIINDAYMKLRLSYPQAKHITCGYSIPGLPRCYHEDYCNDNETGGGNFILKLLQNNRINCMAVFVVRIQNGPKIGPLRFELMEEAIRKAFTAHPYNKYTNANQVIISEQYKVQHDDRQIQRGNIRGRRPIRRNNRIRGRGSRGTNGGEITKRRREDSDETPYHFPSDLPKFDFSAPAKPMYPVHGSLGDSWPTLAQAVKSGI